MIERLNISRTALVVVDLQSAFAKAISDFERIVERAGVIMQGCQLLGIPVIVTEQVPEKLGQTVGPLQMALGETKPLTKTTFSAVGAPGFVEQLAGRDQILLCGIETHSCIHQTALDLRIMGKDVHLLTDALGSRSSRDHEAALTKMFSCGALASTVEMALFELMADSQNEHFRAIQRLIK